MVKFKLVLIHIKPLENEKLYTGDEHKIFVS